MLRQFLRRRPERTLPFFAMLLCLFGCVRKPSSEAARDLIFGKAPIAFEGVRNPERLTDGIVAVAGDHWETNVTSVFQGRGAFVEYDLGSPVPIRAAYLQGDNNDRYEILGADDSKEFRAIWTADKASGPGMRERHTNSLDAVARYVRVIAQPGDPSVSMSEVQLFSETPAPWPPEPEAKHGDKPGSEPVVPLLWFSAAACVLLLLHSRSWPMSLRAAAGALSLGLGIWALREIIVNSYPPHEETINLLRGVAAAVAGAAVVRIAIAPASMMRTFVTAHLAAMALLAVATFYNLGYPQFDDVANDGHTYVHTWDMRVYFPTAKYFDELGFDGLYLASVKAYAEDVPGSLPNRIAHVELRDLRTYEMTQVRWVLDQIDAVKLRFSPERWEEFRNDMAYFRKTMGSGGYLGSLRDHGGNATPAWLLVTYLMFRHAPANATTLLLSGALDPALLLLFFIVVWRTFGLWTALVGLVVYGTTTFPMFGSNWGGSTLRNDWMVLLGLGACALKKERYFLGGVLLAGAAMIRAFPACAVIFLAAPGLWWIIDHIATTKKMPSLRELYDSQRKALRTIAGVVACVSTLTIASSARFGFEHSWGVWAKKIAMHSVQPNVNHVGLRTVIAFDRDRTIDALYRNHGGDWGEAQIQTLRSRLPLYYGFIAVYTALAFVACRRRPLHEAALLGLMMIPIWLYPSNYYLHYVFVLPLLVTLDEKDAASRWRWAFVSAVLLGMSIAEYFGFQVVPTDQRYAAWSWSALVGFALILLALAAESMRLFGIFGQQYKEAIGAAGAEDQIRDPAA